MRRWATGLPEAVESDTVTVELTHTKEYTVNRETSDLSRREFIRLAGFTAGAMSIGGVVSAAETRARTVAGTNIVFVLTDQWRRQSPGYGGNKDVLTPHLDKLADQSVNLSNGFPVVRYVVRIVRACLPGSTR